MNTELITQLEQSPFDLKEIIDISTTLTEKVKTYVTNKEIPIEDRWEVLITYPSIPISNTYQNPEPIDWDRISLYDDFYVDKYATCTAEDFVEVCEDKQEEWNLSDDDITEIKEYFCQKFIRGFINNW